MDPRRSGGEIPEKSCPSCGAAAPVYALACPACGHEWLQGSGRKPAPDPGRRILIPLVVALAVLAAALLLLYALAISYRR